MDITITLTAFQERALTSATEAYNRANKHPLTPQEFVQQRVADQLGVLERAYRDRIRNQMAENFDKLTPAQQQDILTRLGIRVE